MLMENLSICVFQCFQRWVKMVLMKNVTKSEYLFSKSKYCWRKMWEFAFRDGWEKCRYKKSTYLGYLGVPFLSSVSCAETSNPSTKSCPGLSWTSVWSFGLGCFGRCSRRVTSRTSELEVVREGASPLVGTSRGWHCSSGRPVVVSRDRPTRVFAATCRLVDRLRGTFGGCRPDASLELAAAEDWALPAVVREKRVLLGVVPRDPCWVARFRLHSRGRGERSNRRDVPGVARHGFRQWRLWSIQMRPIRLFCVVRFPVGARFIQKKKVEIFCQKWALLMENVEKCGISLRKLCEMDSALWNFGNFGNF